MAECPAFEDESMSIASSSSGEKVHKDSQYTDGYSRVGYHTNGYGCTRSDSSASSWDSSVGRYTALRPREYANNVPKERERHHSSPLYAQDTQEYARLTAEYKGRDVTNSRTDYVNTCNRGEYTRLYAGENVCVKCAHRYKGRYVGECTCTHVATYENGYKGVYRGSEPNVYNTKAAYSERTQPEFGERAHMYMVDDNADRGVHSQYARDDNSNHTHSVTHAVTHAITHAHNTDKVTYYEGDQIPNNSGITPHVTSEKGHQRQGVSRSVLKLAHMSNEQVRLEQVLDNLTPEEVKDALNSRLKDKDPRTLVALAILFPRVEHPAASLHHCVRCHQKYDFHEQKEDGNHDNSDHHGKEDRKSAQCAVPHPSQHVHQVPGTQDMYCKACGQQFTPRRPSAFTATHPLPQYYCYLGDHTADPTQVTYHPGLKNCGQNGCMEFYV